MRELIETDQAPAAIGSYSQAIKVGSTIYLAGQIPLDPATMQLVTGDMTAQVERIFENIQQVAKAANCSLNNIVKLTVYLTDLSNITAVNTAIAKYFAKPYPARTSIQVAGLPKNASVEIDAIITIE